MWHYPKKVSNDANRYESAKMHRRLTNGQEVETEKSEKSATRTREYKRDKKSRKEGGGSLSYEMSVGDRVDGAKLTVFSTHKQSDKYTQKYNSLVFHITRD